MTALVLIDTSAWVEALRRKGDPEVRAAVAAALRSGTACLNDPVLLELWNGARGPAEAAILREIEKTVPSLPTTDRVWAAARRLARELCACGATLPAIDITIAASAITHQASLLHCDADFERIPALVHRRLRRDGQR